MAWRAYEDIAKKLRPGVTAEQVEAWLADRNEMVDHPVGLWGFLDRDTDSSYAEPGGRYTLAIVSAGVLPESYVAPGSDYVILLVDGAVVNGKRWQPYMIKGFLKRTRFAGHYDLEWYDVMMEPWGKEIYADIDPNGLILTLNFPLSKATLRFSRLN